MIKATLFICLCFAAQTHAQEVSFEYGEPITEEAVAGFEHNQWLNSNVGINAHARIKHAFGEPFRFLGFFDDHYFIMRGDLKLVIMVFDQQLRIKNAIELDEKLEGFQTNTYLDAIVFNEQICVFYDGFKEGVAKGNRGIYMVALDASDFSVSEPKLIREFPSSGWIKDFKMSVSENGNYLGMVVNVHSYETIYRYSYCVFDKTFAPLHHSDMVKGRFSENHQYRSVFVSNEGALYLLFDHKGQTPPKEVLSTFIPQEPHEHCSYIIHNEAGMHGPHFVKWDDRDLLHMRFVEGKDGAQLFISWFDKAENSKTGFSMYNPHDSAEIKRYDFDSTWVEPFVTIKNYTLEDRVAEEEWTDRLRNAFYDLISITEEEGSTLYIIKKTMPVLIVEAAQGGYNGYTGHYTAPPSYVKNQEGDILIIREDHETGELSMGKIERYTNIYSGSGEVIVEKEGKLNVIYYSIMPEEERVVKDVSGLSLVGSSALYLSCFDKTMMDVSSQKKLMEYESYDLKDYFMLDLGSVMRQGNTFVVKSFSEEHESLTRGSF